jgi:hypothetical protein
MHMRLYLLGILLIFPVAGSGQTATVPATDVSLRQSLTGDWVGVLEYRDYSEPAGSTKRVDLPTWLSITNSGKSMTWKYTYDDGPSKVLEEIDSVLFDFSAKSYSESSNGKPASTYVVDGYEGLKDGRGVLVLHGSGTDNDKPSETRVTMTIRRNLLEIVEEVRPTGSSDPFAFRHLFRFTRALPPAVTGTRP